jgi:hypothetical protein
MIPRRKPNAEPQEPVTVGSTAFMNPLVRHERSSVVLNRLVAAIIAFRGVPLLASIIYG